MQKTMTSVIFIWLLPLTAGSTVTSALPNNSTNITADQLTTQMSTLEQISESLGLKVTTSTTEDVNPTHSRSRSTHSLSSLLTTQTPPATTTQNNQTAATLLSFSQTVLSSSTEKTNTQKSMILTSQNSSETISSTAPLVQILSTQSRGPEKSSASKTTSLSAPTSQSVSFSSAATSTKADTSTSSHSVTHTSGPDKTTAGRTSTYIPEAMSGNQTNSSKIVAGIIGGTLCLMMVGFLVIYVKKNRLQKQQLTTTDWAGPSPFLESDNENAKITLRSSNRISLSSFLPQRLSKRLSLLPERDEELQDMTPTATFGGKHLEGISGPAANEKNVQEQTASVVVDSEDKNKGQGAETSENCVSESSTKNNSNHSEAANLN
ncbi:endochitinase A [Austrofundulus limnaeus]|uniref:Endochitinase A n=1 Tax=Austrofundulus limnaeus TaxID=52670 RepID=A0A2I4C9J1_AUSLI|nr:PREDICTED: endochitinase A-like [Austrofundulus limnaeus]